MTALQQALTDLVAGKAPAEDVAEVASLARTVYHRFGVSMGDAVRTTLAALALGAQYERSFQPLSDEAMGYVVGRFVELLLGVTPFAGQA